MSGFARVDFMKLVVAVIQDYDTDAFLKALCSHGMTATRIASAGGFLRAGNTTVFMGVHDEHVPLVKRLLNQHCRLREDSRSLIDVGILDDSEFEHVCATRVGGGVAFVARVSHFEQVPRAVQTAVEYKIAGD
jgi:uncharacterized protein YaaQ